MAGREPDNNDAVGADVVNGQVLMARELRAHRERVGLSLTQLAARIGYSRTYVAACEKPGPVLSAAGPREQAKPALPSAANARPASDTCSDAV